MKNTDLFRKFGTLSIAGVLLASSFPASDYFAKAETAADTVSSKEGNASSQMMSGNKEGDVSLDKTMKISDLKSDKGLKGKFAAVEGTVSAANVKVHADAMPVTYIQDETGGIAAAGLDAKKGQRVRISGMVQDQKGTRSLLTQETVFIDKEATDVEEVTVSPKEAASKEGMRVKVKGEITAKTADTLTIDGALTVYADSSAGTLMDYKTGDFITASGMIAFDEKKKPRLIISSLEDIVRSEPKKPDALQLKKVAGYSTGALDKDGGVAEIVKYNPDNQKFYVINGKSQTIDIVSLKDLTSEDGQELKKEKSLNMAEAVNTDTFNYGDVTSIDINPKQKVIAAAVQEADYTKSGKIVVMDYEGNVLKTFAAGIQPDMVKMSEDGNFILTADEGEPRAGLENGVDPEGSVTIVNYETGEVKKTKFNDAKVIDRHVHIRNNGNKADAVHDLEPEYLALTKDGSKAYVTLQENNAIAAIDVASGKVKSVKSLGYKDHSMPGNELDAARNNKIEMERLPILGAYMPDSIAHVEIGGVSYLVTANEGDATEWEEFENIKDFSEVKNSIKPKSNLLKGMSAKEAKTAFNKMKNSGEYDKLEVLTDRGSDAVYTLGGRSFSIWKADTMELVYDSGSDFENITAERYPEYFNWSNDDSAFEKRSAKKGPEPEDVKIGMIGQEVFAFVGLERIGGVMAYNISNPEDAQFADYINTRDFSSEIAGDVAPEGLEFVSAKKSPTGRPLVLVGNEVSGTVAVNEVQAASNSN
ncbi:choice-of-anchor I family protein [Metabacillus idriensis]|uniref:choice-of-anchor I family protein n=1 Tax=Metabacillus idriensis TaxID=324768 RepID=UPI003D2E5FD2